MTLDQRLFLAGFGSFLTSGFLRWINVRISTLDQRRNSDVDPT